MGKIERLGLPEYVRKASAKDFDMKEFLARHRRKATQERIKILRELAKKPWFQATCK